VVLGGGVAAAMLLVSGGDPADRAPRQEQESPVQFRPGDPGVTGPAAAGGRAQVSAGSGKVAKRAKRGAPAAADEDLGDVEEILRRRRHQVKPRLK